MRRFAIGSAWLAAFSVTQAPVLLPPPAIAAAATAAPPPAPLGLKVVSLNLYNHPWERAARLEKTVELLRRINPDVVLLQEVARGLLLPGDPSMELSEALGLKIQRYWHEQNWGLFRTGLAVLTRFAFVSSEYHDFAAHGFWNYKGYMLSRLLMPDGKTLQIVNLHMASTTDAALRQAEWTELQDYVLKLRASGPILVAGDFNTQLTDPALQGFVKATGARNLYDGWPGIERMKSWTPDYRDSCADGKDPESELVDFFFAVPAQATPGASPRIPAELGFKGGRIVIPGSVPHVSDHCPIEAEIELR